MNPFVVLHLLVLLTAGVLLGYEAHTGHLTPRSQRAAQLRSVVFLFGTISGASLLIALADGEWLFAIALAPLTLLCLFRFAMLARAWWRGWRLPVYTSLLVGLGLVISVPSIPYPLDRGVLLHGFDVLEDTSTVPNTINPDARRPVRA